MLTPTLITILVLLPLTVPASERNAAITLPSPTLSVGDVFNLSLTTATSTEAFSQRGIDAIAVDEKVRVEYSARVEILEVCEHGCPTLEQHTQVELVIHREEQSGALGLDDKPLVIERRKGKSIAIFQDGTRVRGSLESVLTDVLDRRFDDQLGRDLLIPTEDVAVGDTWELDETLAKRFLKTQGVRVVRFEEPPTATLKQAGDSALGQDMVIAYSMPIAWLRLKELPRNANTADTTGLYKGTLRVPFVPAKTSKHTAHMNFEVSGVVAPGKFIAKSYPFSLEHQFACHEALHPVTSTLE